ncbi:MAG TPA: AAA family ATPase [Rhabdochlamydiaceae bacterium]|jgi:adenosyl cobinamide kinase/adenosyl cobinamide phosphate guanylyltransferase
MALRAIQPKSVEKRLKALFYGAAGVGKSTAAASFPRPYFVDTERGIENDQYVRLLQKNGGAVFQTSDFDELMNEVKSLLTEKHEYKTLVIDPLTTLYNDLLDKSAIKNGTEFGRHYSEANKQIKHLLNLLLRLDMNVIITSHAKNEYGQNMSVIGSTFDCYKKLDYLFDLVFEIQKRGKDRIGIVKKSRIEAFPDGETFPFSYKEIAARYGKEVLERDAVAQELASEQQIREIVRLIDLIKVPEEVYQKWLDKSNSERWEEMPMDAIQKCIDFLNSKIKGAA